MRKIQVKQPRSRNNNPKYLAKQYVKNGLFHRYAGRFHRISNRDALKFIESEVRTLLSSGERARVVQVGANLAGKFPYQPAVASYLTLAIDPEGRLAWRIGPYTLLSGASAPADLVEPVALARIQPWLSKKGFGDLNPEGSA